MIILEHTTGALFSIGPLEVTGTVTTTWAIILVLTVLSILATRNLKDVPGPLQNAAEMALDSLQNYAGHLTGFSVPTACLSVTAALAIIGFFTTHTIGIREQGLGRYLKSFLKPVAIMLPLTILEQFVRPFSLALRLYGNLYGEEMVTENLYNIFPIIVPLVMQVLSLLFCMIQALVFTMLLSIYVAEATESD